MSRLTVVLALCSAFACASEPQLVPIVGPDGSRMFHASCAGQESRCYQLAGERCPQGYDIARTPGERGNFLVRCRQPSYAAASSGWAPALDLAPTPYGGAAPAPAPRSSAAPLTPATGVFPPVDPGTAATPPRPSGSDIGY